MAIFLHPVFSASRVQHISNLHSKFALSVEVCWDLLRVWYGRPHLAQIDPIVLDFAIFPALGNGGLKVSILGLQIGENCFFRPSNFYEARMDIPIGDKLFHDITRRMENFRENRPRDVKNRWTEKKINRNVGHCPT